MSVGSRLFTAVGVLLAAAAVAGQWADPLSGGTGAAAGSTVVAVVGMVAAACGVVAAVAGAQAPDAADPDVMADADYPDVEAVLFAPVSYAAAVVVSGGAASIVGVAAAQPWLTWVGVLAAVLATARQVVQARATGQAVG